MTRPRRRSIVPALDVAAMVLIVVVGLGMQFDYRLTGSLAAIGSLCCQWAALRIRRREWGIR